MKNGLNIDNAKYINLTYDPNYVPFFKDKGINIFHPTIVKKTKFKSEEATENKDTTIADENDE